MESKKLKKGEIFFHKDLNNLICCRDEYFNICYDDEDYTNHLKENIKRYTVDNSGKFHTGPYKFKNQYSKFIVIDAVYGGGDNNIHSFYPDAWIVYTSPIEDNSIIIKFFQETSNFAHAINSVKILK